MKTIEQVKGRPVLFNGDMVRAILDGRKTQTRRVVKPQPNTVRWNPIVLNGYAGWTDEHGTPVKCPCGQPGDRLWVRETWHCDNPSQANDALGRGTPDGLVFYKATEEHPTLYKWKPSIQMPRWASRILLEITDVRVERVQDISAVDALMEGPPDICGLNPQVWFVNEWNSINKRRGFGWDANPWVWVIEFRIISR